MADLQGRRAFIGRGVELARLDDALAAVAERRAGRTVVIGGEAGIGKSRLLERFADDAARHARVVSGACLEVVGDALPYGPFVEILRQVVRESPVEWLPSLLGPGRAELTRLLPELAIRAADLGPELEGDRASQARLFELLLGVFERLAREQPLVVVIEDVHWADRSTRDLIGFLARALRDDPVLLLLTTRTDATGDAVGNVAFLAELEREDEVDRFDLGPFDHDEVAELAATLLDEPPSAEAIDRLAARTDGNPFYVEELVLAGATEARVVPPVLRDVLVARFRGLSATARSILRAAAVAGRRIDDELVATAMGLSPGDLGDGLREAEEAGILVRSDMPDGPVTSFRHALLQEVIDGQVFPGERAALHLAFAGALEARLAAGDRRVGAVALARHWDAARQPVRALPYLVQAAAGAEGVYAFAEARRLWERAAAVLEDLPELADQGPHDLVEILVRAGDCAALTGDPRRAAELVQRALLRLYPDGDPERILQLESRLRWHLWWSGERAGTMAAVERALATLPVDAAPAARARVLAQRAGIEMLSGDFAGSAVAAREAIEIGERAGVEAEIALAYGVLGFDLAMLGDVDAGIAEYRKGQAVAERIGSVEGVAVAATNLAALLDRVGRSEAALEAAREGYALTERYGVPRTFGAILLGHAAKAEFALGRWDDADRTTADGLRRGAIDAGASFLSVNRARLLTGRGRFAEAEILLRRARATDARLGGTDYRTAIITAEADVATWTGRLSDALDRADEGLAMVGEGPPNPSLAWLAAIVLRAIAEAPGWAHGPRAQLDAPLRDRANAAATRIQAAVAAAAARPGFATGERPAALLALLRAEAGRVAGRQDPAAWRDVGDRWEALRRPFPVGHARLCEAQAIVAARGDRARAAAALAEAAEIAAGLGAAPLAERAAAFARQARISLPASLTGAAPPGGESARDRAPDELTAREAEVLQLVAAGWTNQQIADALFITRKTASVHVSNVMAKLGATNRGEAAAMAHRLGMVVDASLPIARS